MASIGLHQSLSEWCLEQLSILNFEMSEDLIKYLITMENAEELKIYLTEMFDVSNPEHCEFIDKFMLKWKNEIGGNQVRYKKPDLVSEQHGKNKSYQRRSKEYTSQLESESIDQKCIASALNKKDVNIPNLKKKQRFSSVFSPEAKDVVTLPGRYPCTCQASKHKLINNCLRCGRIVCEQEGSGPCFTCKNLVCTKEQQQKLAKGSKQSEKLLEQLMRRSKQNFQEKDGHKKAIDHKNKLLEYDKTVERRTKVIDDESDYYSIDSNKWLSAIEKKELKQKEEEIYNKKHRSHHEIKLTLDFAGRKIYETDEDGDLSIDLVNMSVNSPIELNANVNTNINPSVSIIPQYEMNENISSSSKKQLPWEESTWLRGMKIQDVELQKMFDEGMCLSVQQPYASFLISGIKLHEGRTWYTPHRGRLWIHAGAKVPTQQEVSQIENSIRIIKEVNYIQFPEQYPTGCLLGCVDIIDCLPQEEYQIQYPNGVSASPYVFICENPQELIVKFPMRGKVKIFKLDPKLHQAAKKTTRKMNEIK